MLSRFWVQYCSVKNFCFFPTEAEGLQGQRGRGESRGKFLLVLLRFSAPEQPQPTTFAFSEQYWASGRPTILCPSKGASAAALQVKSQINNQQYYGSLTQVASYNSRVDQRSQHQCLYEKNQCLYGKKLIRSVKDK